jgi:hypothetical protein
MPAQADTEGADPGVPWSWRTGRWPALHGGFQGALFVAVPRCGVDQGDRRASCR